MGGGGGSGGYWYSNPQPAPGWVKASKAQYEGSVNGYLRDLLSDYNNRDTAAIHRHLTTLKQAISSDIDGFVETRFGGSVKKHTAVDGLSDVDTLVVLNRSSLADYSPAEVLAYVEQRLRARLPNTDIKAGSRVVTVTYSDGIQVQLLPVLETVNGIRIPDRDGWSRVVRPQTFAAQLTETNQRCGNQVVPTIKLFKGLQMGLPKDQRLSGYHVEALAVEAFRDYDGRFTTKDMLAYFVESAKKRVLTPFAEKTGQTEHIDDKLGTAYSAPRLRIETALGRISNRISEADRSGNVDLVRDLFESGTSNEN